MKKFLLVFAIIFTTIFTAKSQDQASTEGKEFWVGFLPMIEGLSADPQIIVSSRLGAEITISIPQDPTFIPINKTVPINGTLVVTDIPRALAHTVNTTYEVIQKNGILITSNTNNISVVASNQQTDYTEAALVLPIASLGQDYIINNPMAMPLGVTPFTSAFSVLRVVAVQDNTELTITPSVNFDTKLAGVPFNITLQRGESMIFRGAQEPPVMVGDITGTTIKSV